MANGDAPPRANDSVTPVKESHPQVQVSIEDVKEFLSTVKEGVSGVVDTATRLFGAPEIVGAAGTTTGAEGEVNPGLTPHGGKQGKPVIDFNPSAGGGCFGDIPSEEGVGPSHTGGKIPLDLQGLETESSGRETPALTKPVLEHSGSKPNPPRNPSEDGGCFGGIPGEEGVGPTHSGGKINLDLNKPATAGDTIGGHAGPAPSRPPVTEPVSKPVDAEQTGEMVMNAVTKLAKSIQKLDGEDISKIASTLFDWNKLTKSEVRDYPKETSEIPSALDRHRPEIEKRARFDDAMKDMAEDFPDTFQASQELMQEAFRLAQTGDLDVNQMRDLAQRAAKEFAEDPSGEAAQRFRALSEQLQKDYGVNINIGQRGLEIRNESQGENASMIRFDQHGNMTAKTNVAPGGTPQTVPAEEALKNITETRRQNAFDNEKTEVMNKLKAVGEKVITPSKPFPRGKDTRKGGPIKVYEDALLEASSVPAPVVLHVGR